MGKHRNLRVVLLVSAAVLAVLCAVFLAGVCSIARRPLTVLMYHHIVPRGEPVNGMAVTADRFEADMRWLKEAGYTTVLPRELAEGAPLPDRAVLISFDDGYASNYEYAFPVLRSLNMKAAIAVVGKIVDSGSPLYLNWDMCREMSDSGLVEIGSHSYDLHNLDQRGGLFVPGDANGIQHREGEDPEAYHRRVDADLEKSIQVIRTQVRAPVRYFAYPFGAEDPWEEAFIRSRFALTLTTRPGRCDPAQGLYGLPRLTVTMDHSARDCFSWKSNISLLIKEFKP